jgi:LacI family transcriptional regulator
MDEEQTAQAPNTATLKDNTVHLMGTLIRSNYFGQTLPPMQKILQHSRIPRSALEAALLDLENQDLIVKKGDTYESTVLPDPEKKGKVAFLLNSDIFMQWYGIFQEFLIGFEEALREEHYEVVFRSDFGNVDRKAQVLQEFRESGVSGVAFASYAEPKLREYVQANELPAIVLGHATIHQQELGCICSDNPSNIAEVVRFLVENGHRHIAYYSTAVHTHDGFQDRLIGYELGMRRAGLRSVHDLAFSERHNANLAIRAATIFQSMHPRPTAVACASDREAFELMSELQKSGVNVPNDVSITGSDNCMYCALSEPSLTSVDLHARMIGRAGAHYLLNEMQGHQLPIRMSLPTQIVIRNSVVGVQYKAESENSQLLTKKTARITLPEDEDLNQF